MRRGLRFGNIVRLRDAWGVVISGELPPLICWQRDNEWRTFRWWEQDISAPYAHTYEGIPDEVLAKATEIILLGEANK